MATLKEEQCYGLSCGRLSHGSNISVFHVKLTDSAFRAFEGYQNSKGLTAQPSIRFTGSLGKISIPRAKSPNESSTFSFYLTNVGRDNPQGSFDCVQQYITCAGSIELDCVGGIQDKLTVNATDDSYQKARASMAQAEKETRGRGAIVIKPGRRRYMVKKVQIRKPPTGLSDIAPSRQSSRPVLISSSARKGSAPPRPLRERLAHLLALKPYGKAELILRLQQDGLTAQDRDALDSLLTQVGQLNGRANTFTLKDCLFKELQKDWPGYTEGDKILLKKILVRKVCQSQNPLSAPADSTGSPQREQANASPSQKRPTPDFIDPLANKKPRISHLISKPAPPINGKLSSTNGREAVGGSQVARATTEEAAKAVSQLPLLELPRPCDPLSDVSNDSTPTHAHTHTPNGRDGEVTDPTLAERLGQNTAHSAVLTPPTHTAAATPTLATHQSQHGKSRKKSKKHKDKERPKDENRRRRGGGGGGGESSTLSSELNGLCTNSSISTTTSELADYLTKYSVIRSQEQRQAYKTDFNVEYSEYRSLHSRIEGITRQFTMLDTQLKQLRQGTDKYQTIHNQILKEYRKIKKSNPNYSQDKNRCEYLHNKLAHIKKLIAAYDRLQL